MSISAPVFSSRSPRRQTAGNPSVLGYELAAPIPRLERRITLRDRLGIEADQLQSIQLDWYTPVLAARIEVEARVSRRIPRHHGIAVLYAKLDLIPNHLPCSS